jgi:EpsI family protein
LTDLFRNKFTLILTLVLLAQTALYYSAARGEKPLNAAPLASLPTNVADWNMREEYPIDQETLDVLKADDTLSRMYTSPEGAAQLFIAFFKTQRQGQSPHSPKNCLPGSGWQPSESNFLDIPTSAGTIEVNHYVVSKGDSQSLVLYWYQSHGRVIPGEMAAKFWLVVDSIREHRSDTALVRVVVPYPPNMQDKAEKTGSDFVKAVYPQVLDYLPH